MADQDDDAPIRARMSILTDYELQRVVTVDADQWQPRAVELAREEIARRGVLSVPAADAQQDEQPGARPEVMRGPRLAWLAFGLFLVVLRFLLRALWAP
jgi:hypothetical protein